MLADDVREALPFLQAEREARMVDRCRITRDDGGPGTFDEDTGLYTTAAPTLVYAGCCRVSGATAGGSRDVDVATLPETLGRYTVDLPHNAAEVLKGDTVTVTRSNDEHLIDQTLTVASVTYGTDRTSRKLTVEDPQVVT